MGEEKKIEFSFNINTNENTIQYNHRGIEKLSQEDKIILHTSDILGNNIVLWNYTYIHHILGEPDSKGNRHYLDDPHNKTRIVSALKKPNYILGDKEYENRLEFLTLTDLNHSGVIKVQGLSIIAEESKSVENSFEIVTIMPKSRLSVSTEDRKVFYNVHDNKWT